MFILHVVLSNTRHLYPLSYGVCYSNTTNKVIIFTSEYAKDHLCKSRWSLFSISLFHVSLLRGCHYPMARVKAMRSMNKLDIRTIVMYDLLGSDSPLAIQPYRRYQPNFGKQRLIIHKTINKKKRVFIIDLPSSSTINF